MSEEAGESWDIFLSYSRTDTEFMRNLCADLRSEGFQVWIDEGLEPGSKRWEEEVERAIENARTIVTILSTAAKQSLWVGRELSYGEGHGLRVFPVLAEGSEQSSVPLRLSSTQWIDAREDYFGAVQRLAAALTNYLGGEDRATKPSFAIPEEDEVKVRSARDLRAHLDRCQALIQNDSVEELYATLREGVADRLLEAGAFLTRAQLFETLFLDSETHGFPEVAPEFYCDVAEELARSYRFAGRPREAAAFLSGQVTAFQEASRDAEAARLLAALAANQILLGELAAASQSIGRGRDALAGALDDLAGARLDLEEGRLLTVLGRYQDSQEVLDRAIRSLRATGDEALEAEAWCHRSRASWLMGASEPALGAAARARDIGQDEHNDNLAAWADWLTASIHLSMASITIHREKSFPKAESHLSDAQQRSQSCHFTELEPDLRAALGRSLRLKGRIARARKVVREGLELAEASGYRLMQADLHSLLARLMMKAADGHALKADDWQEAANHAQAAHERALCDGGAFRYEVAVARARSILKDLGVAPTE
jgi:tetratricopeptide (TPR) repeat protein